MCNKCTYIKYTCMWVSLTARHWICSEQNEIEFMISQILLTLWHAIFNPNNYTKYLSMTKFKALKSVDVKTGSKMKWSICRNIGDIWYHRYFCRTCHSCFIDNICAVTANANINLSIYIHHLYKYGWFVTLLAPRIEMKVTFWNPCLQTYNKIINKFPSDETLVY